MKIALPAAFLMALWAVTAWIFLTPEPDHSHGVPHATVAQMDQGGDGESRHQQLLVPAWIFGSLQILGFVGLLAWSASSSPGGALKWATWVICGLAFEVVFAAMCLSYSRALSDPMAEPFWGGFPVGTAWMMYGLWIVPGLFVLAYVIRFDAWIATPEQLRQFDKILKQVGKEPGGPPPAH